MPLVLSGIDDTEGVRPEPKFDRSGVGQQGQLSGGRVEGECLECSAQRGDIKIGIPESAGRENAVGKVDLLPGIGIPGAAHVIAIQTYREPSLPPPRTRCVGLLPFAGRSTRTTAPPEPKSLSWELSVA